jgi:hypothetical protein
MDCVCWEAVEERMNSACLGFSISFGALLSRRRFVRAFVGFLRIRGRRGNEDLHDSLHCDC